MTDEPTEEWSAIASEVEDLVVMLDQVTGWLEGSDAFVTNHGAHSAAVEARKLLARVRGEE